MERPKIKIETDSIDKIITLLGFAGLLVLIGLPFYYYVALPQDIATHYNLTGEPDSFGAKWTIWLLPVTGLLLFSGMTFMLRFPHTYNYLSSITPGNAHQKYKFATKSIRFLSSIITVFFAYLTYSTIKTAFGLQNGLSTSAIGIFLAAVFVTTGYFLYKSNQSINPN